MRGMILLFAFLIVLGTINAQTEKLNQIEELLEVIVKPISKMDSSKKEVAKYFELYTRHLFLQSKEQKDSLEIVFLEKEVIKLAKDLIPIYQELVFNELDALCKSFIDSVDLFYKSYKDSLITLRENISSKKQRKSQKEFDERMNEVEMIYSYGCELHKGHKKNSEDSKTYIKGAVSNFMKNSKDLQMIQIKNIYLEQEKILNAFKKDSNVGDMISTRKKGFESRYLLYKEFVKGI